MVRSVLIAAGLPDHRQHRDQPFDPASGFARQAYLLPNPFYRIS